MQGDRSELLKDLNQDGTGLLGKDTTDVEMARSQSQSFSHKRKLVDSTQFNRKTDRMKFR